MCRTLARLTTRKQPLDRSASVNAIETAIAAPACNGRASSYQLQENRRARLWSVGVVGRLWSVGATNHTDYAQEDGGWGRGDVRAGAASRQNPGEGRGLIRAGPA